jgi:hypothetical protein
MAHAFLPAFRPFLLVAAFAGVHSLAAGAPAASDRKTNSFTLLTTAAPPKTPSASPSSNGVGIGPAKPVVSNPYNVPLLQNAGSLRSGR